MRHFPKEKNQKFQVLRFLSLKYSADFRRSRLVGLTRSVGDLFIHSTRE